MNRTNNGSLKFLYLKQNPKITKRYSFFFRYFIQCFSCYTIYSRNLIFFEFVYFIHNFYSYCMLHVSQISINYQIWRLCWWFYYNNHEIRCHIWEKIMKEIRNFCLSSVFILSIDFTSLISMYFWFESVILFNVFFTFFELPSLTSAFFLSYSMLALVTNFDELFLWLRNFCFNTVYQICFFDFVYVNNLFEYWFAKISISINFLFW